MTRDQLAFLTGLERGCVEDQPQHARHALRLTLRAQRRSDGMFTTQPSGEKCQINMHSKCSGGVSSKKRGGGAFRSQNPPPTPKIGFEETLVPAPACAVRSAELQLRAIAMRP